MMKRRKYGPVQPLATVAPAHAGGKYLPMQRCPTGSGGTFFTIHYQVLDQDGNFMKVKGLSPQEHVVNNGTPQPGFHAFATPDPTLNDGKFLDDPVGTCYKPPVPSHNVCITV